MKLTDKLPKWVEWSILMAIIGVLLSVLGSRWLSNNIWECEGQIGRGDSKNQSALQKAQAVDACLEQKNWILESLLMHSTRKVLRALPNNPRMYAGVWNSSQPQCDYKITLKENGEFTAIPIKCNISSRFFSGSWGVYENQMVWINNGHIWPPDINPIDLVDPGFFLLTEADGSRTKFSRAASQTESEAQTGSGTQNPAAGTSTLATFNQPIGITSDGMPDSHLALRLWAPKADGGHLYVADTHSHTIRKIDFATGVVTTLAGTGTSGSGDGTGTAASFNNPTGITTDNRDLYVADTDNHKIRKIVIATGEVTTLAGSGDKGSADGTGIAASFGNPAGITTDGVNLYVADTDNNTIRKIVIATGEVTTLSGNGTAGSIDGTGNAAQFFNPAGITTDGINLYVADTGNNKIRKVVIATGVVTTVAGSGAIGIIDGTSAAASFNFPRGITTDGSNLYVADNLNNKIRRIVISTGVVTTLAGIGVAGSIDGTGTAAEFYSPAGITTSDGNLYVADADNHQIRKIVIATGVVTTPAISEIAQTVPDTDSAVNTGTAVLLKSPAGVATADGNLYVADSKSNAIHKIVIATGKMTTLAGSGAKGSGDAERMAASFNYPMGVAAEGSNLYVADTNNNKIRKIAIATGTVTTLAGSGAQGSGNGIGTEATFNYPMGMTTDGSNLYVADSDNNSIRKIVIATGVVTTLAGSGAKEGSEDGTGMAATFDSPRGIASDGGNLYVADTGNNKIRKIVISTGVVTTLAGSGSAGSLDATGAMASFFKPHGIAIDGGNLYVADTNNQTIRKIAIGTGAVITLAGSGSAGSLDATGQAASFNYPMGIVTEGGNLYVADNLNSTIRKIAIADGVVKTLAGSGTQPSAGNTTNGGNLDTQNANNPTARKFKKSKKAKRAVTE